MITLTDSAIARVKNLQNQRGTTAPLRVGIKQGGCSGLSYMMDFPQELEAQDQEYDCNGVKIVINNTYLPQLQGMELDYTEDLMGGGFRFRNPNASKSCSCGTSFATPKEIGAPVACS
ncbi:Iron-sulfur cluster assembly accessory protein [Synechococcus sp. PCC 7502]|uniref:HesB/IscA family protein n=1 Tax=Synechococcus sp. PCC 7502 TaxID=1173263 RepID=UPI00029FDB37|nr:iron-sulfur cluster assembly accessory protein [Synechococcus sp. PCC 7502]AFY73344.1 Iron-sulfur cluster assembly accessory protein [Synechococcus sp. PCC 7502]